MHHLNYYFVIMLNIIIFFLSIPILASGILLSREALTACEGSLHQPVIMIVVGTLLILVSLAGVIGTCYRVVWLIWTYVVVMFLLIALGLSFSIFAYTVTTKVARQAVDERGYQEFRLGFYPNWLQKRVTNQKKWNKIRSCLADMKVCTDFHYLNTSVTKQENLPSVQFFCCKPPNTCQFHYAGSTNWTRGAAVPTNPDCNIWDNKLDTLCFNCQSCKNGFIDNLGSRWRKVACSNMAFLMVLTMHHFIGCFALWKNRDEYYQQAWKPQGP